MSRIQGFSGIAPRFTPRSLPPNYATISRNTRLYNNELRAWKAPLTVTAPLISGVIKKLYFLNLVDDRGAWLSFEKDTDVVRGFLPNDERFFYLDNGQLRYSTFSQISGATFTSSPLGIVAPSFQPTVTPGSGGNSALTPEARSYVYTWVTALNEESGPSPASQVITILPGQEVFITGFSVPPANATRMRIYRTLTGDAKTTFFFLTELLAATPSFTDTRTQNQLGESLSTQDFLPPPTGLQGLAEMGNGSMAAFRDNELWFSEPNQPHAWPEKYRKIVAYQIVAIASFGATYGSDIANTLCVGTTGYPYLARGNVPAEVVVSRIADPQPCVSKRSMTTAESGVIYASPDGLMFVGQGGHRVITDQVVRRDEWQEFAPHTIHGHIFDGRYFGWFESNGEDQGFVFDFNDRSSGVEAKDRFSTLDFYVNAAWSDPEVELHYTIQEAGQNVLKKWEAGEGRLRYKWRSKRFVASGLTTYAAVKIVNDNPEFSPAQAAARAAFAEFEAGLETNIVDGDVIGYSSAKITRFIQAFPQYAPFVSFLLLSIEPIVYRLYCEGRLRFEREVTHSEPFRLPSQIRGIEFEDEVEGSVDIREIHRETSMNELVQAGGEE